MPARTALACRLGQGEGSRSQRILLQIGLEKKVVGGAQIFEDRERGFKRGQASVPDRFRP